MAYIIDGLDIFVQQDMSSRRKQENDWFQGKSLKVAFPDLI